MSKRFRIAHTVCCALGLVTFFGASAFADTIRVPGDQPTIQAGIDAAVDGDVVLVADGVYSGPGNRDLDFAGRLITLRSQNGAAGCIIDCQGNADQPRRGFYFHSGETRDAVVDGFTIRRGWASYRFSGGGIRCLNSSPTIRNCIISGCTAGNGGGIACENSAAAIVSCTIRGNSAEVGGGTWFRDASPILTNCAIIGNRALGGGGIFAERSSLSVTDCTISGNFSFFGGGLWCESGSTALNNCTLSGNLAWEFGKAIVCVGAEEATITNCILGSGSGSRSPQIALFDDGAGASPLLTVTYSDIKGGQAGVHIEGGGVAVWGAGNIDRDPLFLGGPSGTWTADAVYDPSSLQITFVDDNAAWTPDEWVGKPIFCDRLGGGVQLVITSNTSITITVWADWLTINYGRWGKAAGFDYQIHDYHLTLGSPCIDAGDPDFVPMPGETDIDGQKRIWNGRVDMGSDEFGSFAFGDLNCDERFNAFDIEPFLVALLDPDEYQERYPNCDINLGDINADGSVNSFDIEPFVELLLGP